MDTAGIHAIEHLGATFLRNDPDWKEKVLYFGPMGCRTGFYLLLAGRYAPEDILDLVARMFRFIVEYDAGNPRRHGKGLWQLSGHEFAACPLLCPQILDGSDRKTLSGAFFLSCLRNNRHKTMKSLWDEEEIPMIYDSRTIEEQAVLHTAQRICAGRAHRAQGQGAG